MALLDSHNGGGVQPLRRKRERTSGFCQYMLSDLVWFHSGRSQVTSVEDFGNQAS